MKFVQVTKDNIKLGMHVVKQYGGIDYTALGDEIGVNIFKHNDKFTHFKIVGDYNIYFLYEVCHFYGDNVMDIITITGHKAQVPIEDYVIVEDEKTITIWELYKKISHQVKEEYKQLEKFYSKNKELETKWKNIINVETKNNFLSITNKIFEKKVLVEKS